MFTPAKLNKATLDQIATLLEKVDNVDFWPGLHDLVSLYVPFQMASVFSYYKDYQPARIIDLTPSAQRDRLHFTLLRGAYLIGPYYNKLVSSNIESGFYSFGEIAPDAIRESEYFRVYYSQKKVADEGMFLTKLEPHRFVGFLIERTQSAKEFTGRELDDFKLIAPVVCALIKQHYHSADPEVTGTNERFDEHFSKAFDKFGSDFLTPREKHIAHLILRGHSSKSGARELDISPNTERVHRRRLYEKLGIASQQELFWIFIESISRYDAEDDTDPLVAYMKTQNVT